MTAWVALVVGVAAWVATVAPAPFSGDQVPFGLLVLILVLIPAAVLWDFSRTVAAAANWKSLGEDLSRALDQLGETVRGTSASRGGAVKRLGELLRTGWRLRRTAGDLTLLGDRAVSLAKLAAPPYLVAVGASLLALPLLVLVTLIGLLFRALG
jgi:hypothetical protein